MPDDIRLAAATVAAGVDIPQISAPMTDAARSIARIISMETRAEIPLPVAAQMFRRERPAVADVAARDLLTGNEYCDLVPIDSDPNTDPGWSLFLGIDAGARQWLNSWELSTAANMPQVVQANTFALLPAPGTLPERSVGQVGAAAPFKLYLQLGGAWIATDQVPVDKASGTRLVVTAAFTANEVINLVTGAGSNAGAATIVQEAGGVNWPTTQATLNTERILGITRTQAFLNGAPQGNDVLFLHEPPAGADDQMRTPIALNPGDIIFLSNLDTSAVNPNLPPVGNLTAPVGGSTFPVGGAVGFSATAVSDPDGAGIRCVMFRIDGHILAAVDQAPYSAVWTAERVGFFDADAVIIDVDNNVTVLPVQQFEINVNILPTISITSPLDGATPNFGDPVTVTATAADPDGTVAQVEFFEDGVSIGVDLTAPYSVTYTPATLGPHALTAEVTDNLGAQVLSAPVNITVIAGAADLLIENLAGSSD